MLGQHRTMATRLVGNGWGIAGQELHIVPCSFSFSLRRQLEMRVNISNFSVFIDCSDFYASSRLTLTKVSCMGPKHPMLSSCRTFRIFQ